MEVRKLFQYIMMGIGAFIFVLAIGLFATYKPSQKAIDEGTKAELSMWGSLPIDLVQPVIGVVSGQYQDLKVQYTEVPPDEMPGRLTTAIATGASPDMILYDDQHVMQYYPLVQTLSFAQYPESTYRSIYADAASVFVLPWTITAFPMAIDPLVLYYNKDLLVSGFESSPAGTWNELLTHITKFTERTDTGRISFATAPLGTLSNTRHGVDVVTALAFQELNPMVTFFQEKFEPTLKGIPNVDQSQDTTLARAFEFYSSFVNPNSSAYTWNTGFDSDIAAFAREDSLYYFGLATEYNTIRLQNPNLNVGIATIPQIDTKIQTKKSTTGRIYAIGIVKNTTKQAAAFKAASIMSGTDTGPALSGTGLAPARIELLGQVQSDPRMQTIYKSALIAKAWWNPDRQAVQAVFGSSLQSLQSQAITTYDALERVSTVVERGLSRVKVPSSDDLPTGGSPDELPQ
jgi:ABC-type glycerol-3-phosphate transport system substrate-binding protein